MRQEPLPMPTEREEPVMVTRLRRAPKGNRKSRWHPGKAVRVTKPPAQERPSDCKRRGKKKRKRKAARKSRKTTRRRR